MTNRAYAKSNGDGLLCSILCCCIEKTKTNKTIDCGLVLSAVLQLFIYWKIVEIIYTEKGVRYITLCVKFIKRSAYSETSAKNFRACSKIDFQFGVDFQARFRFVCVF